ncbi:hypothetical protein V6N12_033080 [Hibiscus sabdariffa]|uniref:Plastocyanin-like domain-containing protein n=1 Tax=Hibiscus sabdariffa TaxID=183260 RepID=A0ABR2BCH3_9ROSI
MNHGMMESICNFSEIEFSIGLALPPLDAYTMNGNLGNTTGCNDTIFQMKLITGRHTSSTSSMLAMNEDKLFSISNHTLIVVAQDASYVQSQNIGLYYMLMRNFPDSTVRSNYNITTGVFRYKNSVDGLNSDASLVKLPLSDNSNATSNFVSRIRTTRVRQNPRLNVSRHIEFTSQLPQPPLIATTPSVLSLVIFSFYKVGNGPSNFNNVTNPMSYSPVDPPLIITVHVPARGWVALRFFANNIGVYDDNLVYV